MKLAVAVRPYQQEGSNLMGFADVTIDDTLEIHGLQIILSQKDKKDHWFVAMPQVSRPDPDHEGERLYSDLVYPINAQTRELLSEAVLGTYFPEGNTYETYEAELPVSPDINARVTPYTKEESNIRGLASLEIKNFHINNIRLLQGAKGLFISYPSKQYKNSSGQISYKDVVEIMPPATKKMVNGMIMSEYSKALKRELEQPKEAKPLMEKEKDSKKKIFRKREISEELER